MLRTALIIASQAPGTSSALRPVTTPASAAADAVDSAIEEVVASIRARQRALASSWQSSDADTEQLRIALREYRRFGAQVRQMSPEEPARPGTAAG